MHSPISLQKQHGSVILEALIAILIFSIGILALVGMQATSISNVADAKYRTDAGFLADQMIGNMWAGRLLNASGVAAPDPAYACDAVTPCSTLALTQAWASSVAGTLPLGSGSIAVSGTEVTVTLTWQPPKATVAHAHTAIAYIE